MRIYLKKIVTHKFVKRTINKSLSGTLVGTTNLVALRWWLFIGLNGFESETWKSSTGQTALTAVGLTGHFCAIIGLACEWFIVQREC